MAGGKKIVWASDKKALPRGFLGASIPLRIPKGPSYIYHILLGSHTVNHQ